MGRHMGPSHSPMGSTPLTSPLLAGPTRMCLSCGTTASPEWRRGPKGQKTLCNACGLKYSRQLKAARLQNQSEYPTSQPT
ncbi:hypothetical protein DSO57_1017953 [Entomophthora muscae]|uniref:Uncharacterized protein n=2 Tax=Entomophthora muscae TaxID=34485 RepID=A0ACC2TS17_9FUNG|nr:hypothetical protein DSO57_1011154 [Entomophthora muscae]KAJ9077315.1 hypothetical protein DSO57_1017953 [Entomophthora muscae]